MSSSTPLLDNLPYRAATDAPGDLALLGLAIAARETSLDGLSRNAPELTANGYDSAHAQLIEAFAVMSAQVLYRANALPAALQVAMLTAAGLPRLAASPSRADLYVDNPTPQDVTWAAGSLVGGGRVQFELARTVVVPANTSQHGPVPLVCLQRGTVGNTPAAFASWSFVTPVPLSGLYNPSPAQGGSAAETDAQYLARAGELVTGRGTANRESDAAALAVSVPGIERALVLPHTLLTGGSRWGLFPWGQADWGGGRYVRAREGIMTVVARATGGGYLSSELLSAVEQTLMPLRGLGTIIHVASPEEVPVDVSLSVTPDNTVSLSLTLENARAAVRKFLSGSTWEWGGALQSGDLLSAVVRADGVRRAEIRSMQPRGVLGDLWDADVSQGGGLAYLPTLPNVLFISGALQVDPA